ncbi:hypothetical protein Hypma_008039 [Hypsizygus marmoreus]|uniref:Uncharacterized protein n=1 Tax=Hypsizygus marmoreus TaxID=39966 RepID=A0A369JXK9_HYPMA|nr:hypothetical protein Hypma_008039 [Hypsizygus marmoreus]
MLFISRCNLGSTAKTGDEATFDSLANFRVLGNVMKSISSILSAISRSPMAYTRSSSAATLHMALRVRPSHSDCLPSYRSLERWKDIV